MLSCYAQAAEAGGPNQQNASYPNLSEGSNGQLVPEEDEEEDVDFNPFLKETPSPEASSSLSSDKEGFGASVVDNIGDSSIFKEMYSLQTKGVQNCSSVGAKNDEKDDAMHGQVSLGAHEKESEAAQTWKPKKRKSASTSQLEMGSTNGTVPINDNTSTSGTEVVEDVSKGQLTDPRNSSKCVTDWDDEDAICRRTRARYSLANFTLDELETFLQETDDDDDLQNVDDEQEYRKFLAAVLHGGDDESHTIQGNENVYDEDEENDADFEIEIEEALESDLEDNLRDKDTKEKCGEAGHRPETRQNRRQKASVINRKKLLGQANRPLRPLLPFVPNTQMATFPGFGSQKLMPEVSFHCPSSSTQAGLLNGFTTHQIGQLHCLIHEHVQLLVQVFSLCVLDPSRQHIAGEVKRMISDIISKRDEVLAWRKVPYPDFCFRPPYIHPSVSDGLSKFCRMECPADSFIESCPQKGSPDRDDMTLVSHNTSSSEGRYDEHVQGGHADTVETRECSLWLPLINDPVLSILDVAPVALLGSYIHDVSKAVQENQQRQVESMFDGHFEREPLFPLPTFPLSAEACGPLGEVNCQSPGTVKSSLPGKPKKTLAATLVESTKKQSVALVSKEIVNLAQRFYPLFNSALFPHKPPPAPVANRVLFTDAEDELLALGLMEYNTDWKSIQQRFLPCKSKHQIFVRQKNRCSSKAPENPIKAVRRMKTSPLTAEEKARIHEGLRVLKLDWMSVWRFIVPYRDPSLLPRQWRIALGIQKSYKSDAVKREKRRLYESQRRKCKAAALTHWETASEKEDYLVDNVGEGGEDKVVDDDEACVHEAFLADWGCVNSRITPEPPISNPSRRNLQPNSVVPITDSFVVETPPCNDNVVSQPENGYAHEFLSTLSCSQDVWNVSHLHHLRCGSFNSTSHHSGPDWQSKSSKSQVNLRPYRVRRKNVAQLVRLAPDLPPVNLPPSVRIISQSVFESYHCGSSCSTKISGSAVTENLVPRPTHVAKPGTISSVDSGNNKSTSSSHSAINLCPQDPKAFMDQILTEEKGAESDLQMHPLLFQAHEDASFPYCQMNASRTFNFLPGNQLQANFSHICKSQDAAYMVHNFYKTLESKENAASSCAVEFHPLLQRADDQNNDTVVFSSADRMSVDSELFPGTFTQLQNCSYSAMTGPQINRGGHLGTAELSGSYEKANDIDLEIHLCSTSRKEKVLGKRNLTKHNSDGPGTGLRNVGTVKQFQKFNHPSHEGNESCPTDSMGAADSNQEHARSDKGLVLTSNSIGAADSNQEHSLPEIVMEQEELSDSEEEIGENVEFECEEMADSEGEESDREQLVNVQNKKTSSVPIEEEVTTNENQKVQQYESGTRYYGIKDDVRGITNDTRSTRGSQKLGLANKGKDKSNAGLFLSLDSSAMDSSHLVPKLGKGANRDSRAGSSLSSRPSRSCKKMMPDPKAVRTQVCPLEMLQQSHLTTAGDTDIIARKRRKRVYRNSAIGVGTGNSECASNNDTNHTIKRHTDEACLNINDASNKAAGLGCLDPSLSVETNSLGDAQVQDVQVLNDMKEHKPHV